MSYQEYWGMWKWAGVPRMREETESLSSPLSLVGPGLGPLSFSHSCFIIFEIVLLAKEVGITGGRGLAEGGHLHA